MPIHLNLETDSVITGIAAHRSSGKILRESAEVESGETERL